MPDKIVPVRVVPPEAADKPAWKRLYYGYAEFYKRPMTDAMADTVWSWIVDSAHVVEGYVAKTVEEGRVVGLAHIREFPRPLLASKAGFLDDLFVDPAFRGRGVVEQIMRAMAGLAVARGWAMVRWITADDNYRARAVYDRLGRRTHWITYDMDPAPGP